MLAIAVGWLAGRMPVLRRNVGFTDGGDEHNHIDEHPVRDHGNRVARIAHTLVIDF